MRFARVALALLTVDCTSTRTVTLTIPPRGEPRATSIPARKLMPEETACVATEGACASVVLHHDMSWAYTLDLATITIDGWTLFRATELDRVLDVGRFPIAPGSHELVVELTFHESTQCFYCYIVGSTMVVHTKHAFTVAAGNAIELHALVHERPGRCGSGGMVEPVRFVEGVRSP
jgi:hypothetical protein